MKPYWMNLFVCLLVRLRFGVLLLGDSESQLVELFHLLILHLLSVEILQV